VTSLRGRNSLLAATVFFVSSCSEGPADPQGAKRVPPASTTQVQGTPSEKDPREKLASVSVSAASVTCGTGLSPNPATVVVGGTVQLSPNYLPAPTNTWSSTNGNVALPSGNPSQRGLVFGIAEGEACISLSYSTVSWSTRVVVVPPPWSAAISGIQSLQLYQSAPYTASTFNPAPLGPFTYQWRTRLTTTNGALLSWSPYISTGTTNVTYAGVTSCGYRRLEIQVLVSAPSGETASSPPWPVEITNPC
jgi:Bacterial Ig-like domain (group 2)